MNLYRLIDEATKTVEGYEKAAKMTAVTSDKEIKQLMGWLHSYDGDDWFVPSSFTRIPHTRKDMWFGQNDMNGHKIFENDNVLTDEAGWIGTVKFATDSFYVEDDLGGFASCCNWSKYEVLSIEGVT